MLTRKAALLTIHAFDGQMTGKTLLMKRLFFVGELTDLDLGYFAHYYGPYSSEVDAAVIALEQHGLLDVKSVPYGAVNRAGFEVRRYDYALTEAGQQAIAWVKKRNHKLATSIATAVDRIKQAGDLNYVDLSIAAKAYFILKQANRAMTPNDITTEAKQFSWTVADPQIESAIGFLQKLGLVTTKAAEGNV